MMKIVVAYCMEDIDATQNIHTSGLGPWRLFHSALTVHSFRLQSRYYARQLLDSMADQRPFKRGDWIQFKNRLRSHARAASIRTGHTRRKPADAIEQIMAQMDRLDFAIESHQEQAMDLYRKLNEAKSTLVLDVRRTRGSHLSVGLILDTDQLSKKRKQKKVQKLRSKQCTRPPPASLEDKLYNVWEFYTELFDVPGDVNENAISELLNLLSPNTAVPDDAKENLAAPFSALELRSALFQCEKCSAPGIDGLPFEYWMNIVDIVAEPFAEACDDLTPELPNGAVEWPTLLGTTLHKKGLDDLLENYRLLSVLDSDLCWREKAISNRMLAVADGIISNQQTAFLQGRQLCDNVMALTLVVEEARMVQKETIILALDQEKTYDRVEWTWLFRVLEKLGFPEPLIRRIKQLYTSPIAKVAVDKVLTNAI